MQGEPPLTVAAREVATLKHELGDDTVEGGPSVSETVLAGGKLTEVACSFGHDVVVELEDDTASVAAADRDVEL